jgi:hypothetical protein
MRKFGCNILAVVQQYDVIKNSPVRGAVIGNSKTFLKLKLEGSRFRRNDERRPGGHNWVGIADCHTENGLISYRLKEKAKLLATAGRSVYDQ